MSNCIGCNNTGKYKKPNDEQAFDRAFDRYADPGYMSLGEAYNKAINEVGYTIVPCSCEKRKEYAEKISRGEV